MKLRALTATGALALAGVVGLPTAAHAAADTTGPKVNLKPHAHYVSGVSFDPAYETDAGFTWLEGWYARYALNWTTSDPSGICSQSLTYQNYDTLGGDTDPVLGDDTLTTSLSSGARSYQFTANGWDWDRVPNRFVLRVTDCAGNTTTSRVADTEFGLVEDTGSAVSYTGTWATSSFSGFSGGTTHQTSKQGAAATFTVPGGPVALVMEKAANRGSADVFVDGVRQATVNTNAATTAHRQVVWQRTLGAGTHTVKVVNKATAGHPRIDVDVLLTSSGEDF